MTEVRIIPNTKPDRGRLAAEYKEAKSFADRAAKRAEELKKILVKDVQENGQPDDRGHKWCPAGDFQLKHELRKYTKFDLDAAAQWAKDHGLWDEVKDVIEVPNEEKILALGWTHPEYSEIIAEFYKTSEVWAFKLIEEKSYEDE